MGSNNRSWKCDPKSWMWEHVRDIHAGHVGVDDGVQDFEFQITNKFQKCLPRQVDEDIRMRMGSQEGCVLLNSKNEYYTPKSVELVFKQL